MMVFQAAVAGVGGSSDVVASTFSSLAVSASSPLALMAKPARTASPRIALLESSISAHIRWMPAGGGLALVLYNVGCALVRDGRLAGWGVIRPCRKGFKIGPLVADDRATAETVLSALLARVGGGEIFLDVPSINREATALAQDFGLAPVFETARMYTGAIPPLRLQRVFGVTSFELG